MKILLAWLMLSGFSFGLTINGNGSSVLVKNFQDSDFKNVLSATLYQTTSGGTTTTATTNNRVFQTVTGPSTITSNLQLNQTITGSLSAGTRTATWISSNTGVATINSAGFGTYVSSGTTTFTCSTFNPAYIAPYTYAFSTTGGGTVVSFLNWAVTSPVNLPAQINSNTDALITAAGTFSSSKQNLFSAVNDSTGTYTRNASVWTGSVDLSGVPAWSSFGTTTFFGALITPTDIVIANHVAGAFSNGNTLRFVDPSNVTYTATCAGESNVNGDLSIVHLTWVGASPTTLKVMTIMPSNYQTYCPDHLMNFFPVICTNQFRQVFVQDSLQASNGSTSSFSGGFFDHGPAGETNRSPWTLPIIGGDSSNPIMAIVNGAPVLLCCNYTANAGPSVSDNISALNTALSNLGSAYTVTTTNLSSPIAFPTY